MGIGSVVRGRCSVSQYMAPKEGQYISPSRGELTSLDTTSQARDLVQPCVSARLDLGLAPFLANARLLSCSSSSSRFFWTRIGSLRHDFDVAPRKTVG